MNGPNNIRAKTATMRGKRKTRRASKLAVKVALAPGVDKNEFRVWEDAI